MQRCIVLMFPPDEKTDPAPVMITTLSATLPLISAQAAANSSTALLSVIALRVAGSDMVSVTMPPTRSMVRKDIVIPLSDFGGVQARLLVEQTTLDLADAGIARKLRDANQLAGVHVLGQVG